MKTYKRRITTIEAIQYTGYNFDECKEFCPSSRPYYTKQYIGINTNTIVNTNDWIIRDNDKYYTMPNNVFQVVFEEYNNDLDYVI